MEESATRIIIRTDRQAESKACEQEHVAATFRSQTHQQKTSRSAGPVPDPHVLGRGPVQEGP